MDKLLSACVRRDIPELIYSTVTFRSGTPCCSFPVTLYQPYACKRQKVLDKSRMSKSVQWSCWESEHSPGYAFGHSVDREA